MAKFDVIVMCGIPGSGKTTFCRDRLFPDCIYISLDRLQTRSAEAELLAFAPPRAPARRLPRQNENSMRKILTTT